MTKQEFKEYQKIWTKNNPDKIRVIRKRYYEKHKEVYNERAKEWRKNNKERYLETRKLWLEKNQDKVKQYRENYMKKQLEYEKKKAFKTVDEVVENAKNIKTKFKYLKDYLK